MIKFLDLAKQYQSIKDEIDSALKDCISNTDFVGGGSASKKFEDSFFKYIDSAFCIGVGNGTDALEIAIASLELPENSEIIVPSNSFVATAEAVVNSGHRVRFVDIDPNTYLITPEIIQQNINKNTRAVIPVHLYGHPCDMDEILKVTKKHDLKVIEDCAQAAGGNYKDKKIGTVGDIGCYSFYPGKNLGAFGDAGALVTNNQGLALKIRMIANHGRVSKYNHEFVGRNSRLDGLQASVLSVKLNHLDSWVKTRNKLANKYNEFLSELDEIVLPVTKPWAYHAFHLYVVRVKNREELINHLSSNDIQTGIHYPIALHKLSAFDQVDEENKKWKASNYDDQLLSLPIGDHLTEEDVKKVCDQILNYYR